MKKMIIVLMSLALVLVGCNGAKNNNINAASPPNSVETAGNLKNVVGIIEATYIENDIKYIMLEIENMTEKLDASNVKDFELLEEGQVLSLTYDENNKIVEVLSVQYPEDSDFINDTNGPVNRIISYAETISLEGLSEYKNANLDSFSEFGIDKITLYTDAENNGQGEFFWDDSNRFVLIAHKDEGGFTLYDERVQIGGLKVNIYGIENTLNISLLDYGTANIGFRVFKLVDGEFVENVKYKGEGNINMINHY